MNKTIIPHKCLSCNCSLWYSDDNRNYVYDNKKDRYLCAECNNKE